MELLRSMVEEVNSILTKDKDDIKLSRRDLRKASPKLFAEFLRSDEEDVVQFLQDTNNLSDVMESIDAE